MRNLATRLQNFAHYALSLALLFSHAPSLSQLSTSPFTPDAQQQQCQQDRDRALRERQETAPDARQFTTPVLSTRLPSSESPCFVISRVTLQGDVAQHFDWALSAVDTPAILPAGNFWGLTNSAVEVKDFMRTGGQTGLVFDAHSRGAMTIGNSLESLMRDSANGILTGTDINLYGPAYSAQKMANMLYGLSDSVKNHVSLQNHADDFVGGLIGGNPATYSTRPDGSNKIFEGVRMFIKKETVHNCYQKGGDTCREIYGSARTVKIKVNVK